MRKTGSRCWPGWKRLDGRVGELAAGDGGVVVLCRTAGRLCARIPDVEPAGEAERSAEIVVGVHTDGVHPTRFKRSATIWSSGPNRLKWAHPRWVSDGYLPLMSGPMLLPVYEASE